VGAEGVITPPLRAQQAKGTQKSLAKIFYDKRKK